ncbi:phosphoglycerate mutase family protein [Moheibacter sediminis]|uniref:Histidine phosphatase superfamily (Branch 1) n=1 Tax=Moheibacter sediminis TaxID=1434700 RepID=A0A1W1YBZ5_9FLAO|nr:phosphoglycerate mutase family protein [Moheibacter sediminis]SMC33692.1 Histidine phosphatase superfamily (branch 1) [Moheibacter sediminis]
MKNKLLSFLLLLLLSITIYAQKTHIYIVRHAEKDISNPQDPNPSLSVEGLLRAIKLADELKKIKISAAYSTPFTRTQQTLEPTAERNRLDIINYDPSNNSSLVNDVLTNYTNKRVIIAGHSNTILEILEAFGGERPISEVSEDDYGNFFHIVISESGVRVFHKIY